MAANIEQIFQDFILNKIKEIEDLNEDKAAAGGVDSGDGMIARQNSTSDRSRREDLGSQKKKHKKHKKHKSKKKKKNREKEQKESSSESGDESDHGTKQQLRGERPTEENKEQGERKSSFHKRHSTGKRKKKKRKRDEEGSSSASDSEFVDKRDSKCGPSTLPWRQEDLPDIIPKQVQKK
ncbi:DNA topoisomerase 1-like [Sphaeramia orbicularis]|uniref:DNA topoisomerase 1-like n=1 Tax=Sphaeramia orbicularis TaxID=375764 RepID=UPI00117FDB34|nr:DNA topoisomerase 1-like [Sphaeramia orbicularis]